jgi:hypothetical protein
VLLNASAPSNTMRMSNEVRAGNGHGYGVVVVFARRDMDRLSQTGSRSYEHATTSSDYTERIDIILRCAERQIIGTTAITLKSTGLYNCSEGEGSR